MAVKAVKDLAPGVQAREHSGFQPPPEPHRALSLRVRRGLLPHDKRRATVARKTSAPLCGAEAVAEWPNSTCVHPAFNFSL
jgi:hypothetical protein